MLKYYKIIYSARLLSILFNTGYLPLDSSGDMLYRLSEITSFILCYILYTLYMYSNKIYIEDKLYKYIMKLSIFLSFSFHLTLNKFFLTDTAWAFALYLEAFAVLPQLIIFYKNNKFDKYISHFLFTQFISKILQLIFWLKIYKSFNLYSFTIIPISIGYFIIGAHLINIIILSHFIYIYIIALLKGVSLNNDI
eukprot:GHVL01019345.1.p1 GENE.GHVL01019345.1~~GHVL01019345.1.p1  ORF type:complete len:227 (+),score=50.88 GHVL01019345.1:101-682(+)